MEEKDNAQVQNEEVKVESVEENKDNNSNVESLKKNDKKQPKVKKVKEKKKSKKEDLSEYEGLSDDELYTKIQTQKLLKKKQNKKIATIIGMGFAFVLAVVIIILAALPVSLKPRCMAGEFVGIKFYPGTATPIAQAPETEEEINKFMKIFDKSFNQTYISAIFNGSLFSYNIEETLDSPSTVINSELVQNNTYYIGLSYAEEQVFTYQNGKAYSSKIYSSGNQLWSGKYSGGKLYFNEVYFEVNNTNKIQETNVYVVVNYPKTDDENSNQLEQGIIKVTVKANTYAIYEAWDSLTTKAINETM